MAQRQERGGEVACVRQRHAEARAATKWLACPGLTSDQDTQRQERGGEVACIRQRHAEARAVTKWLACPGLDQDMQRQEGGGEAACMSWSDLGPGHAEAMGAVAKWLA